MRWRCCGSGGTDPRIDLVAAVRYAIETTRPLIERLDHALITGLPSAALIVSGDADRLVQVFVNLLEPTTPARVGKSC